MKKKLFAVLALVVLIALVVAVGVYENIIIREKTDSKKIIELKAKYGEERTEESFNAVLEQYAKENYSEGAMGFIDSISDSKTRAEKIAAVYDRNSTSPIKSGNTMSNIRNGGTVAFSGDKIFFVTKQGTEALVKRENGTNTTLVQGRITSLNIVGEWIYYADENDYCVYKIREDGSGHTRVGSFLATQFYVIGDKMYFINISDERYVYSADISGKNLKKLSERSVDFISIYGSKIYICDNSEGGKVYSIPLMGGEETLVFEYGADFIVGYENGLLFRKDSLMIEDDGSYLSLCKVDSTTGDESVIYNSRIGYISMSGEDIIFVDFEDNGSIMKSRDDGTGQQKIINDEADSLMIDGDFIYYYNEGDGDKLYRINKNGHDRECLE